MHVLNSDSHCYPHYENINLAKQLECNRIIHELKMLPGSYMIDLEENGLMRKEEKHI
jgi:hypothetical protein